MLPSTISSLFLQRGFKSLAGLGLIIFTASLVWLVRANSYFLDDDYDHFIQAAQLPLAQLVAIPIDVHYAPLHKLLSALIQHLAPLNFDAALLVMLVFHGLAMLLLYKLLQALSDSPVNLLIVLLYGCNPFLLHPLMWWSSGIHRFPYIFLCLASLYAYLRFHQSRRPVHLACCYLAFFLAFGFYSKAILIPLYILGLEFCLSARHGMRRLLLGCVPGAAMLLVSLGYVWWYLNFAPLVQEAAAPSILLTGKIVLLNFQVLAGVLSFNQYGAPLGLNLLLAALLLAGIFYSLWKNRWVLPIWLVLFGCVAINFAMLASSGRGQMFGESLALVLRYYFEVMFLIALFGGLLLAVLRGQPAPGVRPAHWMALVLCLSYVSVLGWVGRPHFFSLYTSSHVAANHYMQRLLGSLDRLPPDRTLSLAAANLPLYVYGQFINTPMPMERVLPLRYPRLAIVPRAEADYEVDETGALLPLSVKTEP